MNGKCLCGDAMKPITAISNVLVGSVGDGLKKFGEEVKKTFQNIGAALRMVIKMGTWFIPGIGQALKGIMKALDKALPPSDIQTGSQKADDILKKIGSFI